MPSKGPTLQVVSLKPGDILVIKVDDYANMEAVEKAAYDISKFLEGKGMPHAVVVHGPGTEISKQDAEDTLKPTEFRIGSKVKCHVLGSWVDGKIGVITALDVVSSDNIYGHFVEIPVFSNDQPERYVTVIEPEFLEILNDGRHISWDNPPGDIKGGMQEAHNRIMASTNQMERIRQSCSACRRSPPARRHH